jgi:hypothetical protein
VRQQADDQQGYTCLRHSKGDGHRAAQQGSRLTPAPAPASASLSHALTHPHTCRSQTCCLSHPGPGWRASWGYPDREVSNSRPHHWSKYAKVRRSQPTLQRPCTFWPAALPCTTASALCLPAHFAPKHTRIQHGHTLDAAASAMRRAASWVPS